VISCSLDAIAYVLIIFVLALPARADDLAPALAAVRAEENQRIEIFDRAAKAVVCIFDDLERSGGGSGVIFDPEGYGLTNFHVVQSFIEKRRGYGALSDGNLYPLIVLGIDPGGDIVMFKLAGKDRFDFAELGDSDRLRVGQAVAALGNPFLLAEDYQPTISLGVISGLHRYQEGQGNLLEYADCIQVSTSINPGNSGGPLFDLDGRVVGINGRASFEERGRVNVGLGYAVSINQVKRFMPGLRAGWLMEHGTLGATVRTAGDDLIVGGVQDFSPAERAGIQLGDALVEVAGRSVRTPNDYNNLIAILPANWPVRVKLLSGGQSREVAARLERLSSKLPLYMLDIERNRAELRKIWMNTPLARLAAGGGGARILFAGHVTIADAEIPFTLTCVPAAPGQYDFESSAPGALEVEPLVREWAGALAPLFAEPKLDDRWSFIGGDEVDGRIVNVIEYRPDAERRIRWKLDWESGALRQIALGAGERQEAAFWKPQAGEPAAVDAWPTSWTRVEEGASPLTLHVEPPRFMPTEGEK
jgi:S1-C subfamily serine protease